MNTQDFIKKAQEKHGDKYDYSKVDYKNAHTKICIICPEHGEFWQTPTSHLQGTKCPKCSGKFHYTTQDFIEKAKQIHGDKYDYSKVEYKNNSTKVCIVCPEHGEFWQTPVNHLTGNGCPNCCGLKKQYKFNLLEEFTNEYAFRTFLKNNDINILLAIITNIEPKYEPIKKDIEYALKHAKEVNPIHFLQEKYNSQNDELENISENDSSKNIISKNINWDDDNALDVFLSQDNNAQNNELSIEDIIRNNEEEIQVINRLDSEHLIIPEIREYIMEKYKNDALRAWMAKRDNK